MSLYFVFNVSLYTTTIVNLENNGLAKQQYVTIVNVSMFGSKHHCA